MEEEIQAFQKLLMKKDGDILEKQEKESILIVDLMR